MGLNIRDYKLNTMKKSYNILIESFILVMYNNFYKYFKLGRAKCIKLLEWLHM